MSEVTRRSALWLMAAGAGTTLVAGETAGEIQDTWTIHVEIDGAAVTAANIHSVEFANIDFPAGKAKREGADVRVVLRAASVAAVRKELETWFADASSRRVKVTAKSDHGVRTFNLIDCFPTEWSTVELATSADVSQESITVKVSRFELA